MDDPTPSWDITCASCQVTIGAFEDGRFAHDLDCRRPLRIDGGALACCGCGGPLEARPRVTAEGAPPRLAARREVRG